MDALAQAITTALAGEPPAAPAPPPDPAVGAGLFRAGPMPAGVACTSCHNQGGRGGAGPTAAFRQTPALFGLALLEHIPDAAIEAAAAVERPWWRTVHGRVGRTADGAIGRFGWRAEAASLAGVVESGCHAGPVSPDDAAALTAWIRDLPAPQTQEDTPRLGHGFGLFVAVGCADCHLPTLGGVTGAFTDLLLHDMGRTGGPGASTGAPAAAPATLLYRPGDPDVYVQARRPDEWRTPPLWGLRDSAPYLHDGRARTIADAILAHEGEGAPSVVDFLDLPPGDRADVLSFLSSLTAP